MRAFGGGGCRRGDVRPLIQLKYCIMFVAASTFVCDILPTQPSRITHSHSLLPHSVLPLLSASVHYPLTVARSYTHLSFIGFSMIYTLLPTTAIISYSCGRRSCCMFSWMIWLGCRCLWGGGGDDPFLQWFLGTCAMFNTKFSRYLFQCSMMSEGSPVASHGF